MKDKKNTKFIFPKWANTLPLYLAIGLTGAFAFVVYLFWYWFSPNHLDVGYQPKQPIPFSHKLHSGLGMDCRYCHNYVDEAAHSNVPSTETCMNCHNMIKTDSPHIKKIRESWENDEPIEWVRIHKLPDYSYFNHARHVNAGVSCVSCHGRVDQMKEVYQVESLSMSWCLECHRNPAPNIRPKEFVTQMDWESDNQLEMAKELIKAHKINPGQECSVCHR